MKISKIASLKKNKIVETMTKSELIAGIRQEILNENLETYRHLFETTKIESTSDAYWKEALTFYNALNEESKDTFYKIIKQIMIDSLSNMFAVLDGVSLLENQEHDFDLMYQGRRLNGDLQDSFLEEEKNS